MQPLNTIQKAQRKLTITNRTQLNVSGPNEAVALTDSNFKKSERTTKAEFFGDMLKQLAIFYESMLISFGVLMLKKI